MANYMPEAERAALRSRVLLSAARLFLLNGYSQTSTREIASQANVNVSAMNRAFGSKENILCALVHYVLERQFSATAKLVAGKTDDPVLFYAAETALQLYMAESGEHIRDLYAAAYTMPGTVSQIYHAIAEKTPMIFGKYLPGYEGKDFYELEIASGSVIRGYMLQPCDMYFPVEQKVRRFLETSLRIYRVPEEKIREAVAFVERFDYRTMAGNVVDQMLSGLENEEF